MRSPAVPLRRSGDGLAEEDQASSQNTVRKSRLRKRRDKSKSQTFVRDSEIAREGLGRRLKLMLDADHQVARARREIGLLTQRAHAQAHRALESRRTVGATVLVP